MTIYDTRKNIIFNIIIYNKEIVSYILTDILESYNLMKNGYFIFTY